MGASQFAGVCAVLACSRSKIASWQNTMRQAVPCSDAQIECFLLSEEILNRKESQDRDLVREEKPESSIDMWRAVD